MRKSREQIRELLRKIGLEKLCERVGVTQGTIKAWAKKGVSRKWRNRINDIFERSEKASKAARKRRKKPVLKRDIVKSKMQKRLEYLAEVFKENSIFRYGISPISVINVFRNPDDTIDGQLTFAGFPRGTTYADIFSALGSAFDLTGRFMPGTWISMGVRWPMAHTDDDDRYDHYRGLNQHCFYWQRATEQKIIGHYLDLLGAAKNMREWGWRKITHLIIRLHWNRYDRKPEGRG